MSDEAEVITEAAKTEEAAPKRKAAKPATTKYEVINGAISPEGGSLDALVHPGSIVELTAEQAKHYNNLGYLKPHLED